jgi:DNA-binding response OmpR family regulator
MALQQEGLHPMLHELADPQLDSPAVSSVSSTLDAFVIDDDPLMAEVVSRALTRHAVRATRFDEPERLLAELAAERPALLVTDLAMPRMDGVSVVREARRRGYRGTIVLVTASRERERIVAAIAAGADEVLSKPIKEADLEIIIEKVRSRRGRSPLAFEALVEILDAIDQGAVALDESSAPVYVNAKGRALLGAESVEEVAEVFARRCPPGLLEGGGAVTFVDVAGPEGGRRSPVGFEVLSLKHGAGDVRRLVLLHDFSEWRKLDELHARFATYLSHRMRTPLTSVRNAVRILSETKGPLDGSEKEKFLDIGCRNIEKLIDSFDELQKIFMIESGEISACRALVRIDRELASHLAELERGGVCAGFTVSAPSIAVPTGRAALVDFVSNAVDAIRAWLGEPPFVACVVSSTGECEELGTGPTSVTIALKHRGRPGGSTGSLDDYLRRGEERRRLVLERLAEALGGDCEVGVRDAVLLRLPADPPFDRDRDLVHPLHMMLERAELERSEFHMLTVRMVGALRHDSRFARLFAEDLHAVFGTDGCTIAKGEKPDTYAVFIAGLPHDRVAASLAELHERFASSCRERGEELYPSVRGEIAYSHSPGETSEPNVLSQLEGLL